jgi:hypothetical protein
MIREPEKPGYRSFEFVAECPNEDRDSFDLSRS